LRYLRWGRDGEAVQLEKGYGVENCLRLPQNPQRQVVSLREDMADRCQVGRQVRPSCSRIAMSFSQEPEQLQGLEDRILAWAPLHYTKRRSE